jgi:tetratricopeptide (TPR) repeat protein
MSKSPDRPFWRYFLASLSAALLAGSSPALCAALPSDDTELPPTPQALADIANYTLMAHHAADNGFMDMADGFYQKLLTVDAPDEAKKAALLDMFEVFRSRKVYSKAIAVGERIHELFPMDPAMPDLLLKLGRLYRETGAYQLATSRFYNVLNAALHVDQKEFAKYKDFSTQAQFEIADTFMTSADYKQAGRYYEMLDKLDISPDQKALAQFQIAYCDLLVADYPSAVTAARRFLETFGSDEHAPQCHHVLSVALNALGRKQEATDETLALLKMAARDQKKNTETWAYWQQKTGNQLANGFYEEGEFMRALTIYQAMAKLNNDPQWQWPVIYQIGLCFERLRAPDRAAEAYHFIIDENKKAQTTGTAVTQDLVELASMADWRAQHLDWQETTITQLDDLLGQRAPADDSKNPGDMAVTQAP